MTEPTPHAQKKKHSRQMATSCESCGNFVYDEDIIMVKSILFKLIKLKK